MSPSLAPRSDFPELEETTYLDTASDGIVPLPVREAATRFLREAAVGRPEAGALRAEAYERARDAVARLLGADPVEIAVTHSASEAAGQVAWALRPGPDENVVVVDLDFPTTTYPWLRVARDTGAEVRFVRVLDAPETLSVERIAELVDERTAVVSLSHVQYATGLRLDPAELARVAHDCGALLLLDVAQSAGAVPIDAAATGADVLVGHSGKWLCADTGAGFCWVRPSLVERLEPAIPGWRSTADPWALEARRVELAPNARRLEVSSVSYHARFQLAAAIEYLLGFGIESIEEHDLRLAALLADGLERLGAEILTPRDDALRAAIVAARLPGRDAEAIAQRLREQRVAVSVRLGAVRFGVHLYNDESDVERAIQCLERALGEPAEEAAARLG